MRKYFFTGDAYFFARNRNEEVIGIRHLRQRAGKLGGDIYIKDVGMHGDASVWSAVQGRNALQVHHACFGCAR